MDAPELANLLLNFCDIALGLFDSCASVSLALPSLNVVDHFPHTSVFLGDLLADFALTGQVICVVNQLQPARLSRPVLLVALLPEVSPFPVSTSPPRLLEVAHGCLRHGLAVRQVCEGVDDGIPKGKGTGMLVDLQSL